MMALRFGIWTLQMVGGTTSNYLNLKSHLWLGVILLLTAPCLSQKGDLFPKPDTYQVEGIPPIYRSEVNHLFHDPASIRSNLIWDADSKNRRLLVTDETNDIYLLGSPGLKPSKLVDGIVPHSVRFHPNGGAFLFTSDHEDPDNFQVYVYDFDKKVVAKASALSRPDESIESAEWSESKDHFYFAKVDYDSKLTRLCESRSFVEKCFDVELPGIWYVIDTGGGRVLLKHWKSSSNQSLFLFETASSRLITVSTVGNSFKGAIAGDHVVYLSDGNSLCGTNVCLLSYGIKGDRSKALTLPNRLGTISDLKISPDKKYFVVQEARDGVDNLRVFKLQNGRNGKEVPRFIRGSFLVWNTRWIGKNELAYTLEDHGKPASIHSFNIAKRQISNWTKEQLPSELDAKVHPPEIIKWNSSDGLEISGFVVKPKIKARRLPVLIRIHGGPQLQARPVFNPSDILLASQLGIAIIHTNIRGSSGFGNEYMDGDDREKREYAVKDVRALIDWIGKQTDLDSTQIYLRGESYGGFIALSAAMNEPVRIKGVIAESPIVSIRGYLSQSWIDDFAKIEYGNPTDQNLMVQLDALSPLNNVQRWNKIPTLLTRGKGDGRIPESDVVGLKDQLQKHGTEVWYIYSTVDGHGFGGQYVLASIFKFLKTHLNQGDK